MRALMGSLASSLDERIGCSILGDGFAGGRGRSLPIRTLAPRWCGRRRRQATNGEGGQFAGVVPGGMGLGQSDGLFGDFHLSIFEGEGVVGLGLGRGGVCGEAFGCG